MSIIWSERGTFKWKPRLAVDPINMATHQLHWLGFVKVFIKLCNTSEGLKIHCEIFTSVSRKRRKARFFLMLLRRKQMAKPSATITATNIPPITPAAIRGVLKKHMNFTCYTKTDAMFDFLLDFLIAICFD